MSEDLPTSSLDATPEQFSLLSEDDQTLYLELRSVVGSRDTRYNRFHRLDTLDNSLRRIRGFCVRGDDGDSIRCLVCGVCWLSDDEVAINIRHLRLLLNKSKSTLNGALLKMGYSPFPLKSEQGDRLVTLIPQLKDHYLELRLWSIRRISKRETKPKADPEIPTIPPPSEPSNPNEKSVFDYFPDSDFDFFFFLKDVRLAPFEFGGALTNSIGFLPGAFVWKLAAKWASDNRKQFPKLLRQLLIKKRERTVVTAERTNEALMPCDDGNDDKVRNCGECWLCRFPFYKVIKGLVVARNKRDIRIREDEFLDELVVTV
jgi:hypothetical protein